MKNTHAWLIIGAVFVLALGSIWYMTSTVNTVPTAGETATSTATSNKAHPSNGTKSGASGSVTSPASGVTVSTDTRPKITAIMPSSGKIKTVAAIKGVNFDAKTNVITFGPSKGLHHRDGTVDNQIASLPSSDGKTLTFIVPASGPGGELCDQNNTCATYTTQHTEPGTYMITVINKDGLSNEMAFTVTE